MASQIFLSGVVVLALFWIIAAADLVESRKGQRIVGLAILVDLIVLVLSALAWIWWS